MKSHTSQSIHKGPFILIKNTGREIKLDRKLFRLNNRLLIAYDEYRCLFKYMDDHFGLEKYYWKKEAIQFYNELINKSGGKAVFQREFSGSIPYLHLHNGDGPRKEAFGEGSRKCERETCLLVRYSRSRRAILAARTDRLLEAPTEASGGGLSPLSVWIPGVYSMSNIGHGPPG